MADKYNFYNLEAPFKIFLITGNKKIKPISVNNYLSDLRHFFGWIVLTIKNSQSEIAFDPDEYQQIFSQFLTEKTVNDYGDYLRANNIPPKTINRRFSTLRKFCTFCIAQGWLKTNPAKAISNVVEAKVKLKKEDPLIEFETFLLKHEEDENEAKNQIEDVREFFVISSNSA